MTKVRIRVTACTWSDHDYRAIVVKTGKHGNVEPRFLNKRVKKEVEEYGFAYANISPEYVV